MSPIERAIEFTAMLAAAVVLVCTGHTDWIFGLVLIAMFVFSL